MSICYDFPNTSSFSQIPRNLQMPRINMSRLNVVVDSMPRRHWMLSWGRTLRDSDLRGGWSDGADVTE